MEKNRWVLLLSAIGVLFSGYPTYSTLALGVCPIKESCPFLWGYPVCAYGLILFIILFLSSLAYSFRKDRFNNGIIRFVSVIGILFSVYYSIYDYAKCGGCTYSLLLPTCVYGFVMYLVIFLLSKKS